MFTLSCYTTAKSVVLQATNTHTGYSCWPGRATGYFCLETSFVFKSKDGTQTMSLQIFFGWGYTGLLGYSAAIVQSKYAAKERGLREGEAGLEQSILVHVGTVGKGSKTRKCMPVVGRDR